jgi:hypothetical protein
VAFYCIADQRYFLGAVGLINSLRLVGHSEPIHLLDCGLKRWQRELLDPHVRLVDAPSGTHPFMRKMVAPLEDPAEVMVLIDVDMIATRKLDDLIGTASAGRAIAFENYVDRFVPEWGELLGLGPTRRGTYVSAGLVILGGGLGREVLALWDRGIHRAEFDVRLDLAGDRVAGLDHPFWALEQDVLNAVLATRADAERIAALDRRLAPVPRYPGLRVLDPGRLRCAYADNIEPYVLHHIGPRKPWLAPIYHDAYSRLLSRLLVGDDLPVRVPEGAVPLRLRRGPVARAARAPVDARDGLGWYVRDRLPDSLLTRFDGMRRRIRVRRAILRERRWEN